MRFMQPCNIINWSAFAYMGHRASVAAVASCEGGASQILYLSSFRCKVINERYGALIGGAAAASAAPSGGAAGRKHTK